MKTLKIAGIVFFFIVLAETGLKAQSNGNNNFKGMSLNGSTGLYSIPTARIGCEKTRDIGFDLGYHAIIQKGRASNIPKVALSLFKWVELSAAFDIQPDRFHTQDRGTDFIGSAKIQFPLKNTALALGGNFEALNMWNTREYRYSAGQIYAAVSYAGQLFNVPAETTFVLGKTFRENSLNWDLDFGIGFDLIIFPKVFKRYVHWITDFSNFSYSVEAFGADAWGRGVINTGIRVDLSQISVLNKFKLAIDVLVTDIFDKNRAFSVGLVFGIPVL